MPTELDLEIGSLRSQQQSVNNTIKYRLGMNDILQDFKMQLLGYEKNPDYRPNNNEKKYIAIPDARMCGDSGALIITNYLRVSVDKTLSDTKLTDKEISRMKAYFDIETCKWLSRNLVKLRVVPTHARAVAALAVRMYESAIHRSIGGAMMEGLNKASTHTEVEHLQKVSDHKGPWASIQSAVGGR